MYHSRSHQRDILRKLEAVLKRIQEQRKSSDPKEEKRLFLMNQVRLDDYVDFGLERNGYKDALQYLTQKDRPPPIARVKSADASGFFEGRKKSSTKLAISGLNISKDRKSAAGIHSDLTSSRR